MPVWNLYGHREFQVPFWSKIYLAFVSFKNIILIWNSSKSWNWMECKILVPMQPVSSIFMDLSKSPFRYKMNDNTKQNIEI